MINERYVYNLEYYKVTTKQKSKQEVGRTFVKKSKKKTVIHINFGVC